MSEQPTPIEIAAAVGEDIRAFRDDQQKMLRDASRAMGTTRRQARARHPWRWRIACALYRLGRLAQWVDPTPPTPVAPVFASLGFKVDEDSFRAWSRERDKARGEQP